MVITEERGDLASYRSLVSTSCCTSPNAAFSLSACSSCAASWRANSSSLYIVNLAILCDERERREGRREDGREDGREGGGRGEIGEREVGEV